LAIEETTEKVFLFQQSSFTFIKLRELDDSAKSYEKKMFRDLFDVYGNGKQVVDESLKNKFYKTLEEAKRLLLYGFTQREENRVYSRWIPFNQAVLLLFALLSSFLAHLAFVSILFKDPIEDLAMIALVVMSVTLVFTFGGLYLFTKARRSGGRGLQVLSILLLGVLFGLFILLSSIAFTAGRFLPVVLGLVSFFYPYGCFLLCRSTYRFRKSVHGKTIGFPNFPHGC
jgi:hypothetical protein